MTDGTPWPRRPRAAAALERPASLGAWPDVVRFVARAPWSLHVVRGRPRPARGGGVHDAESGCVLPGLPVLTVTPAPWWTGAVADWVARQLVAHLEDRRGGSDVVLLTGREVGRGWDGELLLGDVARAAVVAEAAVAAAQRHHREVSCGAWPVSQGDVDWIVLP
ncbi:DUF6098 family protein [Aquipuribacter nitratireducens]|uniref:DUF6098 family protein n=1 Tax=Aquipuribacter nitratireducens TaxID=650104 RepID=A0ABW0GKL5_9MICO